MSRPMDLIKIEDWYTGATLVCAEHPDWQEDAGQDLVAVVALAQAHVREKHRVHVAKCFCSGNGAGGQVFDARCIPDISVSPSVS